MTLKMIAKLTAAASIVLISASGAFAYSIHYQHGAYSVTCDNGDRWTIGDGSSQISHETAARICAKRGSSITVNPGSGGGGSEFSVESASGRAR